MSVLRVTKGKVRAGSWEEYETSLRKMIAEVGKVPGLLSRTLARDLNDRDAGYAISLWESKEAIDAYENQPAVKDSRSRFQALFVGDYQSSLCEIRYWDETEFEDLPMI